MSQFADQVVLGTVAGRGMEQLMEYRQNLLECMQSNLDQIKAYLAGIPSPQLFLMADPDSWSAHQIIAHLRDKQAQAYLPWIRKILLDQSPCLESFSGEDWMKVHYRKDEPLAAILAEYEGLWMEEISLLRIMPTEGWSRLGRHPGWGERTVQWWVEQSLVHARQHTWQLQAYAKELLCQPML